MPDFSIAVLDPQAQNPAGGTTGQVNIKRSDRDYDYGWGSLNEAMKGDATAIGETVANMVFPSGSAANAQGNWTLFGSPEGYEADNSDDGTPNLLRVPFAFPDDADGLWLTTTRDGEQARTFFGLNRYAAAEEIPIRAAGESLEIRYHNEFDGEKPTISAKVLKGPLGESTTLSVALAVATPAIGLSQSRSGCRQPQHSRHQPASGQPADHRTDHPSSGTGDHAGTLGSFLAGIAKLRPCRS